MTETKDSWIDSFRVYKDIRMVRILLLGAISGFPWVLIGSSLSLWLKEEGLSRSTIGWAGLIFGVYAIQLFMGTNNRQNSNTRFNKKTRPQKRMDSFDANCNFALLSSMELY